MNTYINIWIFPFIGYKIGKGSQGRGGVPRSIFLPISSVSTQASRTAGTTASILFAHPTAQTEIRTPPPMATVSLPSEPPITPPSAQSNIPYDPNDQKALPEHKMTPQGRKDHIRFPRQVKTSFSP